MGEGVVKYWVGAWKCYKFFVVIKHLCCCISPLQVEEDDVPFFIIGLNIFCVAILACMIYLKLVTKEVLISYCGVDELINQLSWM